MQKSFIMEEQSMKLPTLYKKTTIGKTQTWQIITDSDKYRTISGQQDGKKIQNKWTICKAKNVIIVVNMTNNNAPTHTPKYGEYDSLNQYPSRANPKLIVI